MKFLLTQYREYLESNTWEPKERTHFWATENSKCKRALYWKWFGEPASNPIQPRNLQIMSIGNKVEDQLVEDWSKMGILVERQKYIKIERNGILVSGKIDAIIKETLDSGEQVETPVEVKSYYGDYQEIKLFNLEPNESYAKQLAIYMDALGKNRGILYLVNRGTGRQFQFIVSKLEDKYSIDLATYVLEDENVEDSKEKLVYECGFLKFNLDDAYNHFKDTFESIKSHTLPIPPFQYKYPLEALKKAKTRDISKARNNKGVYGDWECKYCDYKNKCLKEQGIEVGYSEEELKVINEITKGYSKKKIEEPK